MSKLPPDLAIDPGQILRSLPGGVILLTEDLRILWVNPYVAELSGYTLEALTDGRRLTQLTSLAGRIFMESRLQMEMSLAGRVEELAVDLITPSGLRIPTLMNATRIEAEGETQARILVAIGGAVAKRAYEAEVPKAREAAAVAESVKADFLANVSHEIRTPLNGILGVAGALASTPLNERQQQMVSLIQSSSETLERLVSDILEVSRVDAGGLSLDATDIHLGHALESVVEGARLRAHAKGLVFESDLDLNMNVRADAVRLKQVTSNLLDNALKFTSSGSIDISAAYDPAAETMKVRVTDTGIGFPASSADALFERFAQADTSITRRFGGSGLGLTIAKGLVELMDGSISAHSAAGEGSCFTFMVRLPLASESSEAVEPDTIDDIGVRRVLLVEDHPANQLVARYILEAQGIEVEIAENGRLGVEAWRSGAYDLILMDMQMPEMDGLTAIRIIRREEQVSCAGSIPIAVLSANAMAHHQAEALAAGADIHIAKPVTPESLMSGIAQIMATVTIKQTRSDIPAA